MSGEADQLMINEKSILDIELNHFCKDRRDRMASMFGAMRRIRLAFAAKAKEAWRPLTVGVIIEPYVTRCIGSFLYTSLYYTSLSLCVCGLVLLTHPLLLLLVGTSRAPV